MIATDWWPWLALVGLGAYHGLNPGMGWLFAVTLGLQERRRSAVLKALPAIAVGHEVSIAAIAFLVLGAQLAISLVAGGELAAQTAAAAAVLRPLGAVALVAFGIFKLVRPRSHPRWVGLRVGPRDLVVWSFLMSSAHGAGLMLVPVLVALSAGGAPADVSALAQTDLPTLSGPAAPASSPSAALLTWVVQDGLAVLVHSLAMLAIMALVALLVYEKLGVRVLRRAWLNVDLLWSLVLIVAGVVTLFT